MIERYDQRASIKGLQVAALHLSPDREYLFLTFTDGTVIGLECEGDCCSHTWIEGVHGVKQLVGHRVTNVEDLPLNHTEEIDYDWITFYGLRITTDVGAFVIDYRNSSNGYYGGQLNAHAFSAVPGDANELLDDETILSLPR